MLCRLPRWAELWSPWSHLSQPNSADQQVTCISCVLGLFVPMCMEVWEGGFEKRGSKHVLNVARLFDVLHLLFLGPENTFSPMAVILLFMILYLRCILWPLLEVSQPLVQHSVQSPGELRDSYVHLCCRAWSWARTQLGPGGSKSLLGHLFAAANIIVLCI